MEEGATITPVALLPGLQLFWTILGSSFIYNTGLSSLGLLQWVPALSRERKKPAVLVSGVTTDATPGYSCTLPTLIPLFLEAPPGKRLEPGHRHHGDLPAPG